MSIIDEGWDVICCDGDSEVIHQMAVGSTELLGHVLAGALDDPGLVEITLSRRARLSRHTPTTLGPPPYTETHHLKVAALVDLFQQVLTANGWTRESPEPCPFTKSRMAGEARARGVSVSNSSPALDVAYAVVTRRESTAL